MDLDVHLIVSAEGGQSLLIGLPQRLTWRAAVRRTRLLLELGGRGLDGPPLAEVGVERRMAVSVELPITDLAQGLADFYVGAEALLRRRLKSLEVVDLRRGEVVFGVSALVGVTA